MTEAPVCSSTFFGVRSRDLEGILSSAAWRDDDLEFWCQHELSEAHLSSVSSGVSGGSDWVVLDLWTQEQWRNTSLLQTHTWSAQRTHFLPHGEEHICEGSASILEDCCDYYYERIDMKTHTQGEDRHHVKTHLQAKEDQRLLGATRSWREHGTVSLSGPLQGIDMANTLIWTPSLQNCETCYAITDLQMDKSRQMVARTSVRIRPAAAGKDVCISTNAPY
ncbi:uncharacterized protein LOC126081478 [Elephas maximus indicus]|uniref:uncharacterized protein LOC126081478 n=1 Tax=Elephas maximus indicus TaxID=99487 RepID=UPI002115E53C|nr:uncharacterized protein LOC126081478 [Elephas maximus indicus]